MPTRITRKRGRRDKISPLKVRIVQLWKEHPSWRDVDIHNELRRDLRDDLKRKSDAKGELQTDVELAAAVERLLPGVSSIGNFRRTEMEKPKGGEEDLDLPWSLASLKKYPMPAESVAKVIEVIMSMRKRGSLCQAGHEYDLLEMEDSVVDIRSALWISRLHAIERFKNNPTELGSMAGLMADSEKYGNGLARTAWDEVAMNPDMTQEEILALLSSDVFDPDTIRKKKSEMDARFERSKHIFKIADRYNANADVLLELDRPLEEIEEIAKSGKYQNPLSAEQEA